MSADPVPRPWARDTLDRCLWQASALGLAVWQGIVGAVVAWSAPGQATVLVTTHLLVAGTAVPAARHTRSHAVRGAWFAALAAALALDLVLAGSVLAVSTVCMSGLLVATPFLAMRWRAALALLPVVALGWLSAWWGQGQDAALAMALPFLAFAPASAVLRATLLRTAVGVDRTTEEARAEHRRLLEATTRAEVAAEQARVLHDTAINTLAALAQGGAAVSDVDKVRRRCALDAAAVRTAQRGRLSARHWLDSAAQLSVDVEWVGPHGSRAVPSSALDELGPDEAATLGGILRELLVNAEKHAAGRPVTVRVEPAPEELVVTVVDEGPGFGRDPEEARGLRHSVLERAEAAGFSVTVQSRVGLGTRVEVRCPRVRTGRPEADSGARTVTEVGDEVRRAGTWGWCAGVCAALLAIAAVSGPRSPSFASACLVTVLCLVARQGSVGGRAVPRSLTVLLVPGIAVGFASAFLGAHARGGDLLLWQGVAVTPLLVLLLDLGRRTDLSLGLAALVLTAAACAWWGAGRGIAPGTVAVNLAIHLSQLAVFVIFRVVLGSLAEAEERALGAAAADRVRRAALEASTRTADWWRAAQVERALDLLEDVASARVDPRDLPLARRAGQEERSLRQLLVLPAGMVNLGPWLARALAAARDRDVPLEIRVGEGDVAEPLVAERLGSRLLAALEQVPPGWPVVVSCFRPATRPELTLVAPTGTWSAPRGRATVEGHGRQELLVLSAAEAEAHATRPAHPCM